MRPRAVHAVDPRAVVKDELACGPGLAVILPVPTVVVQDVCDYAASQRLMAWDECRHGLGDRLVGKSTGWAPGGLVQAGKKGIPRSVRNMVIAWPWPSKGHQRGPAWPWLPAPLPSR